jgi:hypothetical protein
VIAVISVFGIGYAINYNIAEDTDAYYLPTFLVLTLTLAAGWFWLWERSRRWGRLSQAGIITAAILLPVLNFSIHYRESDRRNDPIADHYVEDVLAGIGKGGLLLTLDWQFYSPFLYLHHIEGVRPDISVVDVNLVRRSWYVKTYLDERYPELMAGCAAERDAYLSQLRLFEQDQAYDPAVITARFTDFLNCLIDTHFSQGEVHLMVPMEPNVGNRYEWVPFGLSFRLHTKNERPLDSAPKLHVTDLMTQTPGDKLVVNQKIRPHYLAMLASRGHYLAAGGMYPRALEKLKLALELDPSSENTRQLIQRVEALAGRRILSP